MTWLPWALASATFAALTAVFAKIGLQGIDSDYATLLRTIIIAAMIAGIVAFRGQWQSPAALPQRSLLFLVLSGAATGASWICYFRALKVGSVFQVAPVDKLSVVLAAGLAMLVLGERPLPKDWVGIALVAVGVLVLSIRG